ncbi:BtrH N-terminal domain-containing protein [Enterococcus sp. AZ196]|uniref:BtrH N-terminal domain-containing protein n=1 Tax=Enterococcus sp. AZ196 TaxID=2774659 RepID=UPI003D29E265
MEYIIEDFTPSGGKHCITNALKQVFDYYDHPLSEAMLFGLGSGLAFTYINLANSPMISGRTKPIEFEEKLAERLTIKAKCRKPKNYENCLVKTIKLIQQNHPVLIYVDMPFMKYLEMAPSSHFGGHAVVLFGFDEEKRLFYVSDRDNSDYPIRTPRGEIASDYHLVSYQEIEQARSSSFRPFPAKNKYFEFDFSTYTEPLTTSIIAAIKDTCKSMLNPPAKLLGINGIIKFSQEILKWQHFSQDKLKIAGITNYFQISQDGGTGGGIFRKMYGEFLLEVDAILPNKGIAELAAGFIHLGDQWDILAADLWYLGETGDSKILKPLSKQISEMATTERALLQQLELTINN